MSSPFFLAKWIKSQHFICANRRILRNYFHIARFFDNILIEHHTRLCYHLIKKEHPWREWCHLNIKEVARVSGVSVATVSRVLNHPEQVQPETKEHILAVMQSLNYQPNWFARGLNFGKTSTIALLVPNIENRRFLNIMTGVETVALKKQHTVLLCNTHANEGEESEYLKMVLERQVDGVILVSSMLDPSSAHNLLGDTPWVHIGKYSGDCGNLCFINYEEGAYQMTTHLLQMGHSSVQILLDESPLAEMKQVLAGYQRAMRELRPDGERPALYAADSVQGGYLAAQKLLQGGSPPRALLAFSDDQAFGIVKAAQDLQIPIPEQLALACLKDSPVCSIVSPAISSMELPSRRLGMVAARMLFDAIEDSDDLYGPQEIILQPQLKIRHSCGNTKPIYELFG